MSEDIPDGGKKFEVTLPKVFFMLELAAATILCIMLGLFAWKSFNMSSADPTLQASVVSGIVLAFSVFAYREAKKRW